MYTNFTFCFSFWGRPQTHYRGFAMDPLKDFRPQTPWPGPPPREPLHCKILGTPMTARSTSRLRSHVLLNAGAREKFFQLWVKVKNQALSRNMIR